MIDLGPHTGFIVLSYAATAFAILALTVWVWTDERNERRKLADLERRGVRRRSAPTDEAGR